MIPVHVSLNRAGHPPRRVCDLWFDSARAAWAGESASRKRQSVDQGRAEPVRASLGGGRMTGICNACAGAVARRLADREAHCSGCHPA